VKAMFLNFLSWRKNFDFGTLRDFPEWPKFVEMSQRRNLMTHNDGCVNEQYLIVCRREGVVFQETPKIGDRLELTPDYMRETLLIVSKVGFMITHTLWRKVLPEDVALADSAMNDEIYDLLFRRRWVTAREFGSFGLAKPMTQKADEIARRMRLINTANAFCRTKQKEQAFKLLDNEDWSASSREFKLANEVLREQYSEAVKIMRSIGKEGEFLDQIGYHTWPLFEEFRKEIQFQETYEAIFGVPFLKKATKDAHAQAKKLISNAEKLKREKPKAVVKAITKKPKSPKINKIKSSQ
jgi:hypothetical protein